MLLRALSPDGCLPFVRDIHGRELLRTYIPAYQQPIRPVLPGREPARQGRLAGLVWCEFAMLIARLSITYWDHLLGLLFLPQRGLSQLPYRSGFGLACPRAELAH